jgi:adenosylcobinamide-phosphate synthase
MTRLSWKKPAGYLACPSTSWFFHEQWGEKNASETELTATLREMQANIQENRIFPPMSLDFDAFAMPLAALAAVLLDRLLGETRRWHPLVGFGNLATALETKLNQRSLSAGIVAWLICVVPWVALAFWLRPFAPFAVDVVLLYFALGAQSLCEHAAAICQTTARRASGRGRASALAGLFPVKHHSLMPPVSPRPALNRCWKMATTPFSARCSGSPLLGGPGALLFRLANTLDAMWGYRTERYNLFGRCAARFDDALNWLPARLTALTYALLGETRQAFNCWHAQAPGWDSPNAGPVMAAGAGSLGIAFGRHGDLSRPGRNPPALGTRPGAGSS